MKYLAVILLLAFTTTGLQAQSLKAKVNRSTVPLGEYIKVNFDIEGDVSGFKPPSFNNFTVLSGPNKSSQMQWINGNFSSSISYSFVLRPEKEGKLTIGAAKAKVDGEAIASKPIAVNVVKGRRQNPSNQQPTNTQNQRRENDSDISSNLFMKLYVDKKDAFVGEQIVATYKLYINAKIVNYTPSSLVFNGFYAQDLEIDPSKAMSNEVVNGKQFTVAEMKKVVLTPQKSGDLEVPPFEMDVTVRVQEQRKGRRSLFDQFFGNFRDARVHVESNKESINVSPLPTANQPGDFNGAVGQFTLTANPDRTEVGVNEAINLVVKIEGQGNISLIGEPNVELPTDFESYDPKTRENIATTASGTRGSKSYEYVLIPRYGGEYGIKPIHFSYFDPDQKKYVRTGSDEITLNITKGAGGPNATAGNYAAPKKEDVQIIGNDIRYIKTAEPDLRRQEDHFFGSGLFYGLAALPFVGMSAAILLFGFFKEKYSDINALKSKRAGSLAKKHLSKAKKLVTASDTEFYDEIYTALFGYLSDKLSIPTAQLNREVIDEHLREKEVPSELQEQLKKALDECEMVRFAPGVVRSKDEMLATSAEIIEALEDEV